MASVIFRLALFVFHLHAKFKHQHKNAIFIAQHFSMPAANIFAGFIIFFASPFVLFCFFFLPSSVLAVSAFVLAFLLDGPGHCCLFWFGLLLLPLLLLLLIFICAFYLDPEGV